MCVLLQKESALVEKIALNLLKTEDSKNMSIKSKRLVAAWDDKFLLKVLRKTR